MFLDLGQKRSQLKKCRQCRTGAYLFRQTWARRTTEKHCSNVFCVYRLLVHPNYFFFFYSGKFKITQIVRNSETFFQTHFKLGNVWLGYLTSWQFIIQVWKGKQMSLDPNHSNLRMFQKYSNISMTLNQNRKYFCVLCIVFLWFLLIWYKTKPFVILNNSKRKENTAFRWLKLFNISLHSKIYVVS